MKPERVESTDHPSTLERLFTESASDLTRYFSRRHGVGEWVQDLVQETFLQMARGLKSGRQLQCARGYLFGIARHLSQAAWTRREQQKVLPYDTSANDVASPMVDERISAAHETIAAL